ncbi:Crp/Fnr family transcriptional regulator [Pseudomonas sp. A6]|uniref:Crp/Fnr family transcriptional regulator n=1 Tax=Pseudomonas sp. A6 TaxID=410021 RepID=UPI004024B599
MPDTEDLLQQLGANPWFARLAPTVRRTLAAEGRRQPLRAGEFVFRQGDRGEHFLTLLHGKLKASTLREDGKEAILAVLEPGHWFGEASMLDGLPRTHDVLASRDSEVLGVDQATFDRLMLDNGFARAVCVLQAQHTRLVYRLLEDAMLRSTRARIASRLEQLARGDGSIDGEQRQLVRISQDELAMMLGISRQTLSLELRELVAGGALELGYRQLRIVSLEKLREMAAQS